MRIGLTERDFVGLVPGVHLFTHARHTTQGNTIIEVRVDEVRSIIPIPGADPAPYFLHVHDVVNGQPDMIKRVGAISHWYFSRADAMAAGREYWQRLLWHGQRELLAVATRLAEYADEVVVPPQPRRLTLKEE